jgi:hypothetical protein
MPGSDQTVDQDPGRRSLADRRIGTEKLNAQRIDFVDLLAAEKMELVSGRWLAHVSDPHLRRCSEGGDLGILGQEVVKTRVDVQPCANRVEDHCSCGVAQPTSVRCETDDEMRGRIACQRLGQTTDDRDTDVATV